MESETNYLITAEDDAHVGVCNAPGRVLSMRCGLSTAGLVDQQLLNSAFEAKKKAAAENKSWEITMVTHR